jgi:hypothetical protein
MNGKRRASDPLTQTLYEISPKTPQFGVHYPAPGKRGKEFNRIDADKGTDGGKS